MLAANRAVAHYLLERGIHALHRVHEKPDARKVLEFEELARAFGYSLGVENLYQREVAVRHGKVPSPAKAGRPDSRGQGRERQQRVALPGADISITPQHYQRLVEKLSGKPGRAHPVVSDAALAEASALCRGFSRPLCAWLRRIHAFHFADSALSRPHRPSHSEMGDRSSRRQTLPRISSLSIGAEATLYSQKHLEEIAAETSETERRAATAERELIAWKTAQFMEQHLGDEYDALIISVQKYGCFVELFDIFVEGLLPISALEEVAGARCLYRERDHAIVAVPGNEDRRSRQPRKKSNALAWKLGDRVRVRAERIDPMRRRVEFALLPGASSASV